MALPFDRCCACSFDGRRVPPQKLGANATNIKVAQGGFPVSSLLQMAVRFILLCVLDVEEESSNLHANTHQNVCYFLISKARVQNHQRQYLTAVVVVAKQRSRSKQDQRVFLSGYNPGLALKQIKLEESTGADLVSAVNVRANPAAARPERLPNSQNCSTVTPQPMI